ncbi:hypothetical protein BH23VER1_BH23VER1_26850 [soil metagenome]
MSWYYYRNAREEKASVLREIAKRRKKGEPFVAVQGASARGVPASSFWGQAWCHNLEAYSDYESRLPRGRSYLRGGNVYDLEISEGYIFAYVAGSGLYEVEVTVAPVAVARWRKLKKALAGEVGNLVDLLGGKLGPGVMEAVTDPKGGLFPNPREIQINCSCPDWAGLCKHAAAVLYGIGLRFDSSPDLLFTLRGIDAGELVAAAGKGAAALARAGTGAGGADAVLKADELSELFGIDLGDPEAAFAVVDGS